MKPVILLAFANERHGERYLDKLPLEQARLREALEPAVEAGLCDLVVLPNATVEDILDTFQKARYKDRIALFHYAGHADGYQLLLESRSGGNVTAHGSGVVSFLGKQASLKLIFLNGCSTQQQAEEMVEAGIPAVIGTSVSIADDIALNLAVRFYTGLGGGASLERAWREAQDEVKMRTGGKGNSFRSLYWSGMNDVPDVFPWNLYLRPGSEIVQSWNLPDAVSNPLFGLPEVPRTYPLPDEPYIFLRRFERKQAEIFFGRSYYIRELYNRITDPKSAHVISLYGQSGVGKSSLFDAGLNPRLEGTHEVRYIRRDQAKGLLGSVMEALGAMAREAPKATRKTAKKPDNQQQTKDALANLRAQMQGLPPELAAELEKTIKKMERRADGEDSHSPVYSFADATGDDFNAVWRQVEFRLQRPLVIILDQVEELFTRPNADQPDELDVFLAVVRDTFSDPDGVPQGKIILGYRKEYFAEIEEGFRKFEISRSSLFLEHLAKRDIVEVVNGLSSHPRLVEKYNLTVENGLGELIANDLLEDKDSPVAPVLQILLTKMWQLAVAQNRYKPQFTIGTYERLKADGILMDDFFEQQIAHLRQAAPDLVASGLAHDILMRHTTRLGTAETRTLEELRALYTHRNDVLEPLLQQLNDLYLLTGGGAYTGLAHDTLAPIVQHAYRSSDSPGQRAARIIENKAPGFDPNNTDTALDEIDLEIVEKGYPGMRVLTLHEQELVVASRKRRDKAAAFRRRIRIGAIAAVAVIVLVAGVAVDQSIRAKASQVLAEQNAERAARNAEEARMKTLLAQEETKRAEAEKARAEKEKKKALDEQAKAEAARKEAEDQAEKARLARIDAENKQKIADELRVKSDANAAEAARQAKLAKDAADLAEANAKKAIRARISADSSFYIAKAKELAIQSQILEEKPENLTLRRKLALIAYRLHTANNGADHDADIYDALNHAAPPNSANKAIPLGVNAEAEISAVAVMLGGDIIVSTRDGKLRAWNLYSPNKSPSSLPGGGIRYEVLATDNDRATMVGGGELEHGLYLFDWMNGRNAPKRLGGHNATINSIVFSPDHRYALSCSDDSTAKLLDMKYEKEVHTFRMPGKVTAIDFLRDGKTFVCAYTTAAHTSTLATGLIDEPTLPLKPLYTYPNAQVKTLAASPSRDEFAVGTNRGAIHLFPSKRAVNAPMESFAGHLSGSMVTRVAYSNTGNQLLSAGMDKTVRLWDHANPGSEPMQLAMQQGFGRHVAFSPEMSQAVSSGDDKKLYICELSTEALAQPLLNMGESLSLTPQEWKNYLKGVDTYGKVSAR